VTTRQIWRGDLVSKKEKSPGMKNTFKIASLLSCLVVGLLAAPAIAEDAAGLQKSGILDQLIKQTGVYDRSKTGKTPDFVSDLATAAAA
jgi:hypothetical protein